MDCGVVRKAGKGLVAVSFLVFVASWIVLYTAPTDALPSIGALADALVVISAVGTFVGTTLWLLGLAFKR
jgi:hypothetical protein